MGNTLIYIDINAKTHAEAGVMVWIHNSLRNKILQYIYWNERILEVRLKLNRRKSDSSCPVCPRRT
jgi:hypothetical protein